MSHLYVNIAFSTHIAPSPTPRTSNIEPNRSIAMTDWPIGASAHPMVVFSGLYESPGPSPLGDARGIVPPHRNDHRNGHQSGYIIYRCFVCCRPGGRQGDTERVFTRWRRPMASGVALDMLHRAMPHVSLQCLTMAINMVCRGVTFVCHRHLFLS